MAAGSFSAGLSGLSANSAYLSVIGNNLANINTVAFKSSAVSFQDLVSQSITGSSANPMQVGLGVKVGSVSPVFSQGAITNTSDATNCAIQGAGFFIVAGPDGNSYTRSGDFSFNADGKLVTPDGLAAQGWTTTDSTTGKVTTTGQPNDIILSPGVLRAPVKTTTFKTLTNLDSAAASGDQFTSSVQLYDALGKSHVMTITYTKGATAGTWDAKFQLPGSELAQVGGAANPAVVTIAEATLKFDSGGKLAVVTGVSGAGGTPAYATAAGGGDLTAATPVPLTDVTFSTPAAWLNGAAVNALTWDIVDSSAVGALTGFRSTSTTASITQNGAGPGMINNITITADGTIVAALGAGASVQVGQIALASFNNPKGLTKVGSSRYGESEAAGLPNVGIAGTGGRGTLIGSALEGSNVDIAEQFTQMIMAQRGYQANSKTITVADEVMLETLNLKR
ncbi:MAG: flagellar hook protein FlgE [Acidobacteriota bacterium]